MQYTTNYNLSLPEPLIDNVDIEVLNDNFSALDVALKNRYITGSYTGDGASTKDIITGFQPSLVIITPRNQEYDKVPTTVVAVDSVAYVKNSSGTPTQLVSRNSSRIIVFNPPTLPLNTSGIVYDYVAFK